MPTGKIKGACILIKGVAWLFLLIFHTAFAFYELDPLCKSEALGPLISFQGPFYYLGRKFKKTVKTG